MFHKIYLLQNLYWKKHPKVIYCYLGVVAFNSTKSRCPIVTTKGKQLPLHHWNTHSTAKGSHWFRRFPDAPGRVKPLKRVAQIGILWGFSPPVNTVEHAHSAGILHKHPLPYSHKSYCTRLKKNTFKDHLHNRVARQRQPSSTPTYNCRFSTNVMQI